MHMIGVKFEYEVCIHWKDNEKNIGRTYGKMFADQDEELNPQAKELFNDLDSLEVMGLDTDKTYKIDRVEIIERKEQI